MRSTSTLDPNSSPLAFCDALDAVCAPAMTAAELDRLAVLAAKSRSAGLAGSERGEYILLLRCK